MTRFGVPLAVWLVLLAVGAPSQAVPYDGGVRFGFQGTVSSISGSLGSCCDLAFSAGDAVTGVLQLTSVGGSRLFSVAVDLPLGSQIGTGTTAPVVLDGAPGSQDRISVLGVAGGDWSALAQLQPGFIFASVEGGFDLVDLDGTVWSGVNPRTGDIPPDYAPDITGFETAAVFFNLNIYELATSTQRYGTIHIQLTALDVPEPGSAALAFASLVALGILRRR